jgi:hypothetical protein
MTLTQKLKKIDFIGNATIIASTIAILYTLTYAGSRHPWGSWYTLVPLLLGLSGLLLFLTFENSSYCKEPVVPLHHFSNRTSLIVYILTFLNSTSPSSSSPSTSKPSCNPRLPDQESSCFLVSSQLFREQSFRRCCWLGMASTRYCIRLVLRG